MSIKVVQPPRQVEPPGRLQLRIFLATMIKVENEATPIPAEIGYEVQEHHVQLGYRVVEGESRTVSLTPGSHDLRHWIVLVGPGTLPVVDMRIKAKLSTGASDRRGFSLVIDNSN